MTDQPWPLLWPSGVQQGPQPTNESVEAFQLQLSTADNLTRLREEYGFYTPALVALTLPDAPDFFAEFLSETNQTAQQLVLSFDRPIFGRLPGWENLLYALPRPLFEQFMAYLGTVAVRRPATKQHPREGFARLRLQLVNICDPLSKTDAAQRTVQVTAVVVETNNGTALFCDDQLGITRLPTATVDSRPYQDIVHFSRALARELSDPYNEAEDGNQD